MIEISIKNKEEYLKENSPFEDIPDLLDQRRCLHCDTVFFVGNYKVFIDDEGRHEFICCPNAPDCDGSIIDWVGID